MLRIFKRTFLILAFASTLTSASAFSLLGPLASWQTVQNGYNVGNLDIGGPMNLGEEYRWNVTTITYGFDANFLNYFGSNGVTAVNQAIAILNNLPPVSKMSASLLEFPTDTRRANFEATALGLIDLKSWALGMLVEEFGLTDPERYAWTLLGRAVVTPSPTNYFVVMRNFDPATLSPTPYVNGTLYTYTVFEPNPSRIAFADAQESPVDPLAIPYTSVAGIMANPNVAVPSYFTAGLFFTGLTRDDVGGIRYLLGKKNLNVESMTAGTIGAGSSGAWSSPGTTLTNAFVDTALRGGVDKVTFKQIKYFGVFPGYTNKFTDNYRNPGNNRAAKQKLQRIQVQPDIIFSAGYLGVLQPGGEPVLVSRTGTAPWANNAGANSVPQPGVEVNGPGVIQAALGNSIVLAFTTAGRTLFNTWPAFLGQADATITFGGWASFDGTTNAPILYPNGASIEALEEEVLNGNF